MHLLQPLTHFPVGSRVIVKDLGECPKGRIRLCAMGLTPGTVVEVEDITCGPCRVRVRGATLVIGKGMAGKIICYPEGATEQCIPCAMVPDSACISQKKID